MPGFQEACQLAHEHGIATRVGLHLVLTEGTPLSERMRRCRTFCDEEGKFCYVRNSRIFRLQESEKEALTEEIHAQIDQCRKHRLPLSHIDSHQHVHTEWAIGRILIRVAKEE